MQQNKNPSLEFLFEADASTPETGAQSVQPVVERDLSLVTQPMCPHVETCVELVDGEQLLDDIFDTLKRYIIADDATIRAAALWAVHTWLMDIWTVSPIANITAPEMRCGKTLLLQALGELVYSPLATSNISSAALYRAVNESRPTLLIDEVDSFLKGNNDARGMINSGLYRKTAFVTRCVGDNYAPAQFSVWCAKALCGIGSLAETLADRSIPLRLRRKLSGETTASFRHSDQEQWSALRSRISRWADDRREVLTGYLPNRLTTINDRANDCWEPLFAIAEMAGAKWTEFARSAATALQEDEDDVPTAGVELLRDVRGVFGRTCKAKIYSTELLSGLTVLGGGTRWSRFNQGRPLSPHQLAKMLREFGIRSKPIRIGDSAGKSGYERAWFDDAFARYLPPDEQQCPTVQQAA